MQLINKNRKQRQQQFSRSSRRQRDRQAPSGRRPRGGIPGVIQDIARPMQMREPQISFVRAINIPISLNPSTGWNSTGNFDLALAFTLSNVNVYAGGSILAANSVPGSSEITSLFEWWRLDFVEIQMFLNANNVDMTTTAASVSLPIINIAFDPNDVSASSLSSILQYDSLRTIQLGNVRTAEGYTFKCQPRILPLAQLATSTATPQPIKPNPQPMWISTDAPNVNHFGVKMQYDPGFATTNALTSNVIMYVRLHYSAQATK